MPPDLEALLADTTFVRRLAGALVRDAAGADDVAQDALVIALERPPRDGRNPRGWLASVVRSISVDRARRSASRDKVESHAREASPLLRPDEIVERLESSRRIAQAVQQLEEPYRTAIYLRYFEGLDPHAIAEALATPVATVKTRLRRGLALLRTRLDESLGGRERSISALLYIARLPSPATGVLVMHTLLKISGTVAAAALLTWIVWPHPPRPLAPPEPLASGVPSELADPGPAPVGRAPAPAGPAADLPSIPVPPDAPYALVLDDRRRPVAGAQVSLYVSGQLVEEARSDAQGRALFGSASDLPSPSSLFAWDAAGRSAAEDCATRGRWTASSGAGARRLLGELVLEAGASLKVRVLRDNLPVAASQITLQLGATRSIERVGSADEQGRARFDHLPATAVTVSIQEGETWGRAARILAAGEEAELRVDLVRLRCVEVTVLEKHTQAPVAGATVRVDERFLAMTDETNPYGGETHYAKSLGLVSAPTDDAGRTRVWVPSGVRAEVSAQAEGFLVTSPDSSPTRLAADATTVTVVLETLNARTVHWPLVPGELPPPPEGTVLKLRNENLPWFGRSDAPPPESARIEGRAIVADGAVDGMADVLATAPDGSLARLWVGRGSVVGEPTSFCRPRRVEVEVRDEEDRPAVGVSAELYNGGGNLLTTPASTDSNGRVQFEGLWMRHVVCKAAGREIGTADLERGDGKISGRVAAAHSFALRVRCDGEVRLPPRYSVHGARVLAEDAEHGILRVSCVPVPRATSTSVSIQAQGYELAGVQLATESLTSDTVVDVDLVPECCLLARVLPPSFGGVRVRLERFEPTNSLWQPLLPIPDLVDARSAANAPDGQYRFHSLSPGRYRVRERNSHVVSDAVDLQEGRRRQSVTLDLSDVVRVRGIVEGPPDTNLSRAWIVLEGADIETPAWRLKGVEAEDGVHPSSDGSFEMAVPTRSPVTLRVRHPSLTAHPERGSFVVREATEDVRLQLVAGGAIQLSLQSWGNEARRDALRVYAYRDEPVGEPEFWFRAEVQEKVARFAGLPSGSWNLWIDPGRLSPPVVVRDVVVGESLARVETHLERGSMLRVRVLHDPGSEPPSISVWARRRTEPAIERNASGDHAGYVNLFGLDKGTFDVTVHLNGSSQRLLERMIEFDGVNDVDVEVDGRGIRN